MRKSCDRPLFSATDLCNYLECEHLVTLGLRDLEEELPKDEKDEELQLIADKGVKHELQFLERLREQGKSIIDLDGKYDSFEARLEATSKGLAEGADVVYQAFLYDPPFHGYSDFLIKTKRPSELGEFSYEVMDAKLAKHSKSYYIIQLCLYSELLEKLQGVMPDRIHVALGDNRVDSYRRQDFFHYYSHLKRLFLEHVGTRPDTYPEPCNHCDKCHFRSLCEKRRVEDDHLSLVANIRKTQIKKLVGVKIRTLEALATTKLEHVKGVGNETFERLKRQADLQLYKRTKNENKYVVIEPRKPNLTLHTLPEPDEGDLFYDIEGDPLYPEGLEYLHGIYYKDNGKGKFLDMWAHSHAEEKASFERLVAFFTARLEKYPNMHIYHYASYEETALKRLMSKYGTMEFEVDELLRRGVLVDLYKYVRHNVQVSEPKYSIKNLEHFYMEREAEVKTAGASVVYFEKWIESHDQKLLDDIRDYNEEDCRSLEQLRDWLLERREEQGPVVSVPDEPDELDEKKRQEREENRNQYQRQLEEFAKALVGDIAEDAELTEPQRVRKLLNDLADFYRREAKPSWWRMFERQTMTTEELIDDSECLGGLVLCDDPAPFQEKRSTVYTYRYPEQDFKIAVKDQVSNVETLGYAGTVFDIDADQRRLQLKNTVPVEKQPASLDLVSDKVVRTDSLVRSLWAFLKAFIEAMGSDKRPSSAVHDLLERRPPRLKGHKTGTPLIEKEKPQIADYLDLVRRMGDTCLFIQGPPGTGKTYSASHLIVGLMKDSKKVGVTANSHKVIHNLLDAVEERAKEQKFEFKGIKKSSWSKDESQYEGDFIESVGSTDEALLAFARANLIAGTAWLFAAMEESNQLDYLFIDEAGQLSLAHLIAAGRAAKNIVLIGDQMQLAQPIQGTHPGESGQSVLDYLLQGRNTIPPEEGVLLETTYRMHPAVCEFISDAIYDGRIRSLPGLERQTLVYNGRPKSAPKGQSFELPKAGIVCVHVEHEDSVQRSEEEAEAVKAHYEYLLAQEYVDKDGKQWRMTPDNILVVSPYNMQVNLLKQTLGDRARVGTVDKFQGQEAEVVIVSMATSNPDDVPRGIDFLYSQNRLNVSLSRARILSVLVMSPRLLNVRCNTIEQMRLVNTLCWVGEYAS